MNDAIRERDAYFEEATRVKDTLAEIIPALEKATGLKADEFRSGCPNTTGGLTPDEWAALWLARAIVEREEFPAFTKTEMTLPSTLAAKANAEESPEGPGRDGHKPLMRNRTANVDASPTGNTAANTFSRAEK